MDMTDRPEGMAPQQEETPVEPMPTPAQGQPVVPPAKPKTNVGFFALGLFAPPALGAALTGITAAAAAIDPNGAVTPVIGFASSALVGLAFFGFLALFLAGRKSGNVRMWSFGKGAMWSYAVVAIISLLAFGTCAVFLQNPTPA